MLCQRLLYVQCSTCVVSIRIYRTQWWCDACHSTDPLHVGWDVMRCDLSICLEMIIFSRERNDGHICRWWWGCEWWWWWWRWRSNPNTHRNKTVTSHHHTTVLCTYRTDKQQTRKKKKKGKRTWRWEGVQRGGEGGSWLIQAWIEKVKRKGKRELIPYLCVR